MTGESKIPEPTEPSLRHRGLSRPTIPAGSRRDPTEKTFHQDAEEVAEAVDYNANSAYAHSSEARQYSEARPYLSEDVPTQQTRDATPGLSPQKKKKSWGSFFFGSKKSSSEQSPIKASPSTTQSRATNETDHILEEEPEDTPMNRAYQERILREERRLEEEEDRHRLGGAQVSDRPDDVDEHLQEKRNRRRPPTTGVTNQRRPKPTSKPIITQPEQPLPQPTHPPVTTPQPALNPTPIQPEARASQREPPGHSSSYQNPSYLQNLTQQTISGQLNAAVRSRAKSDAPTSVPDLAPAAAAPLEKADPIIVEKFRPDSTPSTSIPSTSTPLPTPVESEPLPEGWEEVYTEDGIRYYYHKITRMSRSVLHVSSLNSQFLSL